jgi:hypothetical protein
MKERINAATALTAASLRSDFNGKIKSPLITE